MLRPLAPVARQRRHGPGMGLNWKLTPKHFEPKKEVIGLYKDVLEAIPFVKRCYGLLQPVPVMRKRMRLIFEMNKNVKDPLAIMMMVENGRMDLHNAIAMIYTGPHYLKSKYFGGGGTMLEAAADAWQSREIAAAKKQMRDKARAIASGEAEFTALPGVITDEDGNRTGYSHPKGPLPPGESELFARPPEYKDWGAYSLPDPWNPHNSPEGPPDPHLITSSDTQHKVNLARMGPYARHRLRRFIEHEKKTRVMSDFEYYTYFKDNEVHMMANQYELPEYEWAEMRMDRMMRRCQFENQEVFGPARAEWIEKYKAQFKGTMYAPAVDYWKMTFKQWIPNYSKVVVDSVDSIDDTWDEFIGTPCNYAAYRSQAFSDISSDPSRNPLAITMKDFVNAAQADDPSSARRPYDHPDFTNKWYTDNTLAHLLILQEDEASSLGCPHRDSRVLHAEMDRLKDEIGCVELTERRFKGEWWNRGHIKLMRTMAKIHDMELCSAIASAANVTASSTQAEAEAAIKAKDWSTFTFSQYSYLRYPDGNPQGIHSWAQGESEEEKSAALLSRWNAAFDSIFSYEQTVPVWVAGCSQRSRLNKAAEEGGWTLHGDNTKFWDRLVSM